MSDYGLLKQAGAFLRSATFASNARRILTEDACDTGFHGRPEQPLRRHPLCHKQQQQPPPNVQNSQMPTC